MSLDLRARAWRFERRRALILGAAADAAGWGLAAVVTLAAADQLLSLSFAARAGAWTAGAAALLFHLRRSLLLPWRAAGWDEIFRSAAMTWPATRPMLASAWSLRGDAAGPGESEELRREHLARADALAAELPEKALFPWRPSRAAEVGAAAGAVALALGFAFGVLGASSWRRVLAPWLDSPLDRLVALAPGDASVDWGASTTLTARLTPEGVASGLRGADLALETRGADGAWQAAEWDYVDAVSASFETGSLAGDLDYRARRRDLVTTVRRLRAVAAPRFKMIRAIVHGARGEKTYVLGEDAPVRARRGDWISVRGEAESPLSSAALRLSSLPAPAPMREAKGVWTAGFLAQEDASLSLLLVAADGRRDPSPPSYALSVLGDEKPVVELLSPQVPLQAGPRDSVTIAYSARDDGALTRLELTIKAAGRETRRALPLERGGSEALGDVALSLRAYPPGSSVEFWFETSDDASPPQSARSEKGSVEIVDVDAAHTAALAARDKALAALDRAAETAEKAAEASAAGSEDAAREAAKPLAGRWSAAAGALMAWNEAMRADPRANPGLAEQAAASAENLAAAGMEGLPKAEAALKEGDRRKAALEQAALAEQARSAAAALREGSKMQNAQDMADRAYDAEREGRELGESIERLKNGVSPAEAAELQKAIDGVEAALEELRKSIAALPEAAAETKEVRELPLNEARDSANQLRRALQNGDAAGAAKAARELAEKLSQVSKGLRESGKRAAQSSAGKARESVGKVAQAWREAVAQQEKAVEASRRRENARLELVVRAQKDLLRRAQDAIDTALASKPALETEREAREASRNLSSGKAESAVLRLRSAAGASRLAAVSDRARSAAHEATAKSLDAAADALERGADVPALDPVATREPAELQESARQKTTRLRSEVSSAAGILGFTPGGPVRRIDAALAEQEAGEKALRAGNAAEGRLRGEAALQILQEGDKNSEGSESSSGGMGEGLSRPFQMPGGVVRGAPAGSRGISMGRVRLPTADDYRPPRELREELERSLREPRPAAQDSAIKEYFRRLAR
ncbi:MAG: hypothetical protein HY923_08220 [Elusimicrobia bacterium]|nr:hypothetical protein [Elusimicrobiota bacterium]